MGQLCGHAGRLLRSSCEGAVMPCLYLSSPRPSCSTRMMDRQVSSPMKSAARGRHEWTPTQRERQLLPLPTGREATQQQETRDCSCQGTGHAARCTGAWLLCTETAQEGRCRPCGHACQGERPHGLVGPQLHPRIDVMRRAHPLRHAWHRQEHPGAAGEWTLGWQCIVHCCAYSTAHQADW